MANLASEVTDEDLRELFQQCGTVVSCRVMVDDKNESKVRRFVCGISRKRGIRDCVPMAPYTVCFGVQGFGFVCFSTPEEASEALTKLNKSVFHGKPLKVHLAVPRVCFLLMKV